MYFIIIDASKHHFTSKKQRWMRFILDSNSLIISGDIDNLKEAKVFGSKATLIYENYYKAIDIYDKRLSDLLMSNTNDSIELNRINVDFENFSKGYFSENKKSVAIPLLILKSVTFSPYQKKEIYSALPTEIRNSYYGRKLNHEIPILFAHEQVQIGKKIPDFKVENEAGELMSVIEIIKLNKVTLIDFWAYWCSPCKEDIPHVKEVYSLYRERGFNVVSVSTDPNKQKWKKSLLELNTPWINTIDVNQISKPLFSIEGIPAYILVDQNAQILAIDIPEIFRGNLKSSNRGSVNSLRGERLDAKLKTLFNLK